MKTIKIDESGRINIHCEAGIGKQKGKVCVYYPGITCAAPNSRYKICRNCFRAAGDIKINAVEYIFKYIKAYAVSLLKKMNIQLSK